MSSLFPIYNWTRITRSDKVFYRVLSLSFQSSAPSTRSFSAAPGVPTTSSSGFSTGFGPGAPIPPPGVFVPSGPVGAVTQSGVSVASGKFAIPLRVFMSTFSFL